MALLARLVALARTVANNPEARERRAEWIAEMANVPVSRVRKVIREIERDRGFLEEVRARYRQYSSYRPSSLDFMTADGGSSLFFHCVSLYAFVRMVRPEAIVETGGTPGKSSAFMLRAIQHNNSGRLVTIDLPPPEGTSRRVPINLTHSMRPQGVGSNWCVPQNLKRRQTLLIGSSRVRLSPVLDELREIDLFVHDSDHSYDNMLWEFETAYPYIRIGGFLWSDDIRTNDAWQDFCHRHLLAQHDFASQGVAQKRQS